MSLSDRVPVGAVIRNVYLQYVTVAEDMSGTFQGLVATIETIYQMNKGERFAERFGDLTLGPDR